MYTLTVWLTALSECMHRRKELALRHGIDTGRARLPLGLYCKIKVQ
jgi:hypothetical protein